ncbi:MAG: nitrilase-related carbon-nitrogen hydrolase [Candidatus Eutrophobiaceae bacterium]
MIIHIACAQFACVQSRDENIQRGKSAIAKAAAGGADLLLLPELHAWPYFCIDHDENRFNEAETIPGKLLESLCSEAKQHGILIVTTLFERTISGVYHNTAIVIERDGSVAGTYQKMHIPNDPGYWEKHYFSPGIQGFQPVQTSIGRLGVLICFDQWFPEAARLMALADADLLLYPSSIGWNPHDSATQQAKQLDAWITVQRGHAIANTLPMAASNRVGQESSNINIGAPRNSGSDTKSSNPEAQHIHFWGNSFIAGAQGEILSQAGEDEELIFCEVDLAHKEKLRQVWTFFRDRRIEHYGDLASG